MTQARQVNLESEGRWRTVILRVRQISKPQLKGNLYLIIFDEQAPAAETVTAPSWPAERHDGIVRQIEEELERTRDRLRLVIEQNETSTEELRASNEELQAINEELRSATEELETSKEELQSVNEELITVNQEYREKLEEVSRTNTDLRNLMASTDIATVFLNRDLEIKFYTPPAQHLFDITSGDLGRPLEAFQQQVLITPGCTPTRIRFCLLFNRPNARFAARKGSGIWRGSHHIVRWTIESTA